MFRYFILFLVIICCYPILSADSFDQRVERLFNDESISNDSLYILYRDWRYYQQPGELDTLITEYNIINDTLSAPFYYYLPLNYHVEKKTPILIFLHGGVSRWEFINDFADYVQESPFLVFARENNWILHFPMGNIYTTWWSEMGMENIAYQIRYLKERYKIDDDRVYITGFSDGGSGAYHISMLNPDDYAAFYPLCGNMLVGYAVTGIPVYTTNMQNRFLRAVNTELDELYPAKRMRLLVETAQSMEANILYLEYWGFGHNYDFAPYDNPLMMKDLLKRTRDIIQPTLYWETSNLRWGGCDWIEITALDTLRIPETWQHHKTVSLPEDRVFFGFNEDGEYEGEGVKIGVIVENSVSEQMGLQAGDIIIAMDGKKTYDIGELLTIRNTKKRGDDFNLTIIRNDKEMILEGAFPPVTYHEMFDYQQKSGAVKATYRGNIFDLKTSLVSQLVVYIHPEMVNLNVPVRILVNDIEVFNDFVEIDREFMTKNFLDNKDRSAIWIKRIKVDVP